MTDELLVQRTITVIIKGPELVVDELATRIVMSDPIMNRSTKGVRWKIEQRKDFLDADWNVIPPEVIMEAIRKGRA